MYYGRGNFCDRTMYGYDWVAQYIEQGLDHFGRTTEPKHLTKDNAWIKDYDWRDSTPGSDERHRYYFINTITKRTKTIDRENNINDSNYTIKYRRINVK